MTDFTNDVEQCLRVLESGGVILYPTDTIWALGCDATNDLAVEKLLTICRRQAGKGLVVILPTERDVLQYTANPDLEVFDYLKTQQKPTTVIYEHGFGVADAILGADGSIAIRLVTEDFCRHLLKRFKKPVVATAASLSETAFPHNFSEVDIEIKNNVEYVVQHRQNEKVEFEPSAIIRWKNAQVEVVRP
ncbi:L-threonylcarbamoyladenylate synthase [Aridibaculum aurantiacum]|uniref:L-threonylcarbamoyladenylate synthase n=1 Tax=Aridibaculum aurantiacum TaxID=2810307 RepID=UPI001A97A285|nr:Sua5/YciO/YrdC/YwlC family protein [Aridibaculum aurantiacum]